MEIVTKELMITADNSETYCTAVDLELNSGNNNAFRLYLDGETDGWAILNDEAKALLFPTETAHPFQLDSSICGSRSGGTMYTYLEFNDVVVHEVKLKSISDVTYTQESIIHDEVSNSISSTKIAWHVDGSSTVSAFRVKEASIKLYFYKYDIQCGLANNAKGLRAPLLTSNEFYHGDTVTFSANPSVNATWYGWYADPEHTQLVSTEKTYTVEVDKDLTLYAYATLGTGLYVKKDNEWKNSIFIFSKVDNNWVEINKEDIDDTKIYFYSKE